VRRHNFILTGVHCGAPASATFAACTFWLAGVTFVAAVSFARTVRALFSDLFATAPSRLWYMPFTLPVGMGERRISYATLAKTPAHSLPLGTFTGAAATYPFLHAAALS